MYLGLKKKRRRRTRSDGGLTFSVFVPIEPAGLWALVLV